MRLRNKLLILLGITWLPFLFLASTSVVRNSTVTLALLIILFTVFSFLLIHTFITRRIIKLNDEITYINNNNRVNTNNNDEITKIAKFINSLINMIQVMNNEFNEQVDTKIDEIEKSTNANATNPTLTQASEEKLKHLARFDNVTSLPNRLLFNEILNKAISHAKRHNKILSILLINLDYFTKVNKAVDNVSANTILNEVATRLANTLRTEDVIARLDGDEFIVLLNDIGKPKFASAVAEKLLKACAEPFKINDHEFKITASIGICIFPNDGASLEELLANADATLYKVKHSGGNAYQFYTHAMNNEAHEYIQLESDLRQALKNNELILYYQSKRHIKQASITGVETLIRWPHKELGFIEPAKFITLAEDSGLIMQLGEWALREACKTNKQWQNEGYEHITISVNLSPKQFYHPAIVDMITKVLNETGLNPQYLEIEITEKTVMDNITEAATILNKLKALGVQMSIDHFGTGYTSISHLKQLPISTIKIDQSFIKGLPNNPDDMAITNAFIALAHQLGLEVVAEGVETAEQVQYLLTQQCDLIQGFYLSHPLPAQKIVLQFKKLLDEVPM